MTNFNHKMFTRSMLRMLYVRTRNGDSRFQIKRSKRISHLSILISIRADDAKYLLAAVARTHPEREIAAGNLGMDEIHALATHVEVESLSRP